MFIKIRSWHEVRNPTRVPDTYVTLCGRRASGPTLAEFPGDEKTCETCLRIGERAK
jgi:hypothetical protein